MALSTNYWTNRRILITGAGGFVGSHLARKLKELGAEVVSLIRREDGVDVADREALETFFDNKPSVVFHLAGEAVVERGQEMPFDTFRTNVLGTLNVLELSRIYAIPKIIIASTAQVYGEGKPPFREDDPPRPSRPYETSKTATDLLAQSYADSFNLGVLIPRFANIYGPGDTNFTRLIPKVLKYILKDKPIPVWGGTAKREYLYVDDAVEAYLMLGAISDVKLERNRIFNFGSGKPIAVQDIITTIGKLAGVTIRIIREKDVREGEITDQYISWEKASRALGWKPRVSLDEGLRRTIAWYKEYLYTTTL
jgi:CDP-glucose 4,6-dehydratase